MRVKSLELVKHSPARLQAFPCIKNNSGNACSEIAQNGKTNKQTNKKQTQNTSFWKGWHFVQPCKTFIVIEPKFPL